MEVLSISPKEDGSWFFPQFSSKESCGAEARSPRSSVARAEAAHSTLRAVSRRERERQCAALPEYKCPVCLDSMQNPQVTKCGHSFCLECIVASLAERPSCPICMESVMIAHLEPCTLARDALTSPVSVGKSVSVPPRGTKGVPPDEEESLFLFLLETKQSKVESIRRLQQELSCVSSDMQELLEVNPSLIELGKRIERDEDSVAHRCKRRRTGSLAELEGVYFDMREDDMGGFSSIVHSSSEFSSLRPLATIRYNDILRQSSTIISSIEFSGDSECFATAGVNCKIKIFNYRSVVDDDAATSVHTMGVYSHFPVQELDCKSKINCVCWNPSPISLQEIASTDSDGVVALWDAHVGEEVRSYHEHCQRAWSVDYSRHAPGVFATGSDDCTVKLWSSREDRSALTIDLKANVCSVKFNPFQAQYIAFGCADRYVHYYDLRNTSMPLFMMKDHKKAVSYVKFLTSSELISSSTDSTLKLWDVESGTQDHRARTFTGHKNVRNFVGMSVASQNYAVTGSENNSLFVYHKELSHPIASYKFGSSQSDARGSTPFVTSVCWKKDSNVIIGANSNGVVNILELV